MSIVAVRKYETHIEIAADTQITCGYLKRNRSEAKLFKQGDMIIGSAGLVQETSFLRVFLKTHKVETPTEESVLNLLVEFHDWARTKDSNMELRNHYLFVIEDKVLHCHGLDIAEVGEYEAIGSGGDIALGVMYCDKTPEQAVRAACHLDLYCSGEVEVIRRDIE